MCPPGSLDRSPCGTGTSARVALLHTRGELDVGEERRFEGPLGTFFSGAVASSDRQGELLYVRPRVSGRAYLTGFHQFVLEQDDPLPGGFRIGPKPRTCRRRRPEAPNMTDTRKPPLRSASWFSRLDNSGFEHRTHLKARGAAPEMFDGPSDWHRQFRLRPGALQRASHGARRVGQPGRAGEWRLPSRVSDDVDRRLDNAAERHAVPQPDEHGARGLAAGQSARRRRLADRLRQHSTRLHDGAASVDLPTIVVHGGAMVSGYVGQRTIGSGTDIFKLYDDFRTGRMSEAAFLDSEASMSRSDGHCNTMGTAATMGCLAEALGLSLPGSAAIPAVDARRKISAQLAGRRAVELVEDLAFSRIVDRRALENAIRVNAALGGSTNAVLHLTALAGRLGIRLTLDDFQANCEGSAPGQSRAERRVPGRGVYRAGPAGPDARLSRPAAPRRANCRRPDGEGEHRGPRYHGSAGDRLL